MEPLVALEKQVTLADVKASDEFATFPLVTRSRLSVAPVSGEHFNAVLKRAATRLPRGRN
jgi:predicted RNA-binding protein with PUA-like domain